MIRMSTIVAGIAGIAFTIAMTACGDKEVAVAQPAVSVSEAKVHQVPAGTPLKFAFITNNSS